MDISVVVLTYNEEENIGPCLSSLLAQDYRGGEWEILVVDGRSTDRTREIVSDFMAASGRVRLVENPRRKIAPGRNEGIENSSYPFIAYTDADCVVQNDWLEKLSAEYRRIAAADERLGGVGAGNVPFEESSRFMRAIKVYLDSLLGCFNSVQGRNHTTSRRVESLACLNVLYKKSAIRSIGGFDESLGNVGEDLDLNLRLKEHGYNLYYVPGAHVFHKLRPNLRKWLKNVALYGRGRAIVTFKHRLFHHPFYFLPLCFSLGMFAIPAGLAMPLLLLPALYFPAIALYALALCIGSGSIRLFPDILVLFICTHVTYSSNLLFQSSMIAGKRIHSSIRSVRG